MLDELRQIAIFAKAMDHGSFKGAADELRLAPSVVSHHISQLEEKLGVTLIHRSTRRLTLTREGTRLLEAGYAMRDAIGGALDEVRGQADAPSGVLRIAITSGLSQSKLVEGITAFCETYPDVRVQLAFSDRRPDLIAEGFDVAIQVGPSGDTALDARALFKGECCVVAAPSYLAKQGAIAVPQDLEVCRWVTLSGLRGAKPTFEGPKGAQVSVTPKGQISADTSLAVYRFAKAGAGVAIVPSFLVAEDVAQGTVQVLLPDWRLDAIDVVAEWPANVPKAGIIALFVEALSAAVSEL